MSNTFTQIFIHIVFSVKYRQPLIIPIHKIKILKYITGVVKKRNCKLLRINSVPDHIHLLISLSPDISISNLVKEIKVSSTDYINKNKLSNSKFLWQNGYGAFSHSNSQVDAVIKYIDNQEEHHKKKSFKEEYLDILKKFNIDYNVKYVFDEEDG